jgi:hypothetical protein
MRPRIQAAIAFLAALAPVPAAAQAGADADTREVQAYRLTMPKLRQLNQFVTDLYRQRDADPAYQQLKKKKAELAALAAKDELTEAEGERMAKLEEEIAAAEEAEEGEGVDAEGQTLTSMAERMTADPRVASALKSAGLAAREAATLQLAFFQAALTAELLESGTIKEIPKEANTENVRFYQANKAEIATLTALAEREERE